MTGTPFPIDPELTGLVLAYQNAELIADRVLPRIGPPLSKEEFTWWLFDFAQTVTEVDTKIGRKSQPNEVEFGATERTAKTEDFGLDDVVPNSDISNAASTGYNPLAAAAQGVMDLVLLGRERRVANLVFNAATYAAANKTTLSGTSQWSDASSDPIADITSARDSMIMDPNVLVCSRPVWTKISTNPAILKAVNRNEGDKGVASKQAVADLLELDDIVVGSGWMNTAKKGQAPALARVWGKHAALIRRDNLADASGRRATFGMTRQFGTRVAGQIPEPKIGLRGSTRVRAGESVRELITAPDLGFFFQNAVA